MGSFCISCRPALHWSTWPAAGFVALGGALLFTANDGQTGLELWRTDGTPEGTVQAQACHQRKLLWGTYHWGLDVQQAINLPNFGTTGAQAGAAKTYYVDDLAFVGSSFSAACSAGSGVPTPAIASHWARCCTTSRAASLSARM